MSYREKAADQASYLNAVIWALLAVAEAVADHE